MPRTAQRTNQDVAGVLDRIGDLLETREENPFRVRSYRTAAESVRRTREPLAEILEAKGKAGLTEIEGVGEKLASLIEEYLESGTAEILEELEQGGPAAGRHRGAAKRGVQPQEKEEPRGNSGARRTRSAADRAAEAVPATPSVDLILAVDEEYRAKAAAGSLKKIAPKHLNPEAEAWLPIMSVRHEGYKFTAMFSNTARAHEAGKTGDWVVVYYKDDKAEQQCTVVTEQRGPLKGKRVIRGREQECAAYYAA